MKFLIIYVIHDPEDMFEKYGTLTESTDTMKQLNGFQNCNLVFVLNQSKEVCPTTYNWLKKYISHNPQTKLVVLNENKGCAFGINAGLKFLNNTHEFCLIISPDAYFLDKDFLNKAVIAFQKYPKIGILHPYSIHEDAESFNISKIFSGANFVKKVNNYQGNIDDLDIEELNNKIFSLANKTNKAKLKVKYPQTTFPLTSLVIKKSVFDQIGFFDENFFVGGENTDFCLNALKHNIQTAVLSNSLILHRRLLLKKYGGYGKSYSLPKKGHSIRTHYWNQKWGKEPHDIYRFYIYGSSYKYFFYPILKSFRKIRSLFK